MWGMGRGISCMQCARVTVLQCLCDTDSMEVMLWDSMGLTV